MSQNIFIKLFKLEWNFHILKTNIQTKHERTLNCVLVWTALRGAHSPLLLLLLELLRLRLDELEEEEDDEEDDEDDDELEDEEEDRLRLRFRFLFSVPEQGNKYNWTNTSSAKINSFSSTYLLMTRLGRSCNYKLARVGKIISNRHCEEHWKCNQLPNPLPAYSPRKINALSTWLLKTVTSLLHPAASKHYLNIINFYLQQC